MSVRIGDVKPENPNPHRAAIHVHASRGGVELLSDPRVTLEPVEARNYAALLIRAADEAERMRARPTSTEPDMRTEYDGTDYG